MNAADKVRMEILDRVAGAAKQVHVLGKTWHQRYNKEELERALIDLDNHDLWQEGPESDPRTALRPSIAQNEKTYADRLDEAGCTCQGCGNPCEWCSLEAGRKQAAEMTPSDLPD